MIQDYKKYISHQFDFDQINIWEAFCSFDYGVLMTDENGVLIFYNEVQARIDKLNPADVIGKKITEVYKYNNDSSTCMRVLKHGRPITNYALSYRSANANVGNTIHSVFPLFRDGKVIATICFVKDYNILERTIPSFLLPHNNQTFADGTRFTFASIIGSSPVFVEAVKNAKTAANSPSPVMLYGETGTGKELFAQAIHNFYYGKQKQCIDVNCAAIPDNLFEGILFGTTKGAFTGAMDRIGLLETANGGTIFLDEINSMSLPMQGKLLRVLQEKKVRPLGSLSSIDLDIKVISSVNADPRELVSNGTFRMDLFYRLAVIYIRIPPLRERIADVEELGRHFLQKFNRQMGKKIRNISPDVINFFWNYSWPGNVRELEHVIESAVNAADRNEKSLKLKHCYFANLLGISEIQSAGSALETIAPEKGSHSPPDFSYDRDTATFFDVENGDEKNARTVTANSGPLLQTKREYEKTHILQALERTMGNIAMAAKLLGLSRQLLGYKIKKMGLYSELNDIKLRYRKTVSL